MHTVHKYCYTMRRKNAHTVDAHTIDGQRNISFFVTIPGYVTHYK